MTRYELQQLEREADEALFKVDPDFARELGYVPYEEQIVVCVYCNTRRQRREMLAHQHAECERSIQHRKSMEQLAQGQGLQSQMLMNQQQLMMNRNSLGHSMFSYMGGSGTSLLQQIFGNRFLT